MRDDWRRAARTGCTIGAGLVGNEVGLEWATDPNHWNEVAAGAIFAAFFATFTFRLLSVAFRITPSHSPESL